MKSIVANLPMIVSRPTATWQSQEEIEARRAYAAAGGTIRAIISATAAYYDVEPWQILNKRRFVPIPQRRAVAFAVARSRTNMSLPDIAARFGGFHHTTVLQNAAIADCKAVASICTLLDETRI